MRPTPVRLVLDVGNTRTKAGLFSGTRPLRIRAMDRLDEAAIRVFLAGERVDAVILGSVAAEDDGLMRLLEEVAPVVRISGDTPAHLQSCYDTPETLGADRWANAVAASLLFPGRPVLAISLGTCATYDLVDAEGSYQGGLISPGFRARAQAMWDSTARLPLVAPPPDPVLPGRSTLESLAAGVHHGLRCEIEGVIRELGHHHPGMAVVITGGDATRFARALENGIFAHPFLTLSGLNAIALHRYTSVGRLGDPR